MPTNTKELFKERNKYKIISSISAKNSSLLFDSSLDRSFGKKAPDGSIVLFNRYGSILSPANISSTLATVNTENNTQVLNFVALAFNEMRESLEVKYLRAPESAASAYRDISPHRGWQDYAALYRGYLDAMYDKFKSEYFTRPGVKEKIVDATSFIHEFIIFQGIVSQQVPFTLSSFVASNACPVHVSGLVIDIASEDCGNDYIKTEKYLKDVNFSAFVEHCASYGFAVDKNAPWRLYANMNSTYMKEKLNEVMKEISGQEKDFTIDDFYNFYYRKAGIADFLSIIESYAYIYTKLVNDYPSYSISKECDNRTTTTVKQRQRLDTTRRTDVFFGEGTRGYPFWIRMYVYSKIIEKNLNFSQGQMDSLVKKAVSLQNALDIRRALVYTDEALRDAEVIPASLMKNLRF